MTIMVYHMISFCRYLSTVFLCAGYNCCQAQGCLLPLWLRRRGGSGRTEGQQYLRSQLVAVVVWARQAPPGGPVHRADSRKACCYYKRSPAQACSRAKTGSQDGSSLIRSKGWHIEVYSMMCMLYTQSISCKLVFFTFGCRIGCAVHGVCMLA